MNNNPFVDQPLYSRTICMIMRDINKIEKSLNSEGHGKIDVVIVIDTSGSMNDVIESVKDNVALIFDEVVAQIPDAVIGLVQQGDSYQPSVYKCQPTNDTSTFQAAINTFVNCGGSNEEYVDSLLMGVEQTTWREDATKLVIIIGDERADQPARSHRTWADAYTAASDAGVIAGMIIAKQSAYYECYSSYNAAAEATGGLLLVAPTNNDVVAAIVELIGYFAYDQTTFYKYTPTGKISLGQPDGGVAVPDDEAIADTMLTANPLLDMRKAVQGIVQTRKLKAGSGKPFNWNSGSADNLYFIAMGDRTRYGATGGARYAWTRTSFSNVSPYDIDIGEIFECVQILKAAAGV